MDLGPWRRMLISTAGDGYVACCHAIANANLRHVTPQIAQPVLAIGGSIDSACSPENVRAMAEKISDCRYRLIEGVGHLPPVEKPEVFARLIIEFLSEIENSKH